MLDFAPSGDSPRFAFRKGDKVTIDGIAFQPVDVTDAGYLFCPADGTGVTVGYNRSQIARFVELGCIQHERGALLPEGARRMLDRPADLLSSLPENMHKVAREREAVVRSFLSLEEENRVNRTDESIDAMKDSIVGKAARFLEEPSQFDGRVSETKVPKFSARTLRRWLKAYEGFGLSGLYGSSGLKGNRDRNLCADTRAILADCVRGYMSPGITQSAIVRNTRRAFEAKNVERRRENLPDLECPSKETIRREILSLDPYHCDVARLGLEKARKKHAPVGTGLDVTRPLQRVEMDTWQIDLISLMADSGLLNFLDDEDKLRLGLTGKKKRWHLTVAICATTRCILAMRLSRSPNSQATVQAIEMIGRDKGVWTDAVGALTPWSMRGTPELIATDCGKEYVSYDVAVAAQDLGISLIHAPAGLPEMRARVERVFKTISVGLMPRLTGRTFGNILERGDYNSEGKAALTVDDLCAALIRWVVDIYHRLPHEGLDGETPANCWNRLVDTYGVAPPADLRRRRLAFGTRLKRTVQKDGITYLGIRYHSDLLAETMLHRRNKEVKVRWYNEDLGAIAVEIDGEWIEVPSVFSRFRGVRAHTWFSARNALRARFKEQAAFEESVINRTIDDIERINGDAMARVGLLADDWSEERLERAERKLFIGFFGEPDRPSRIAMTKDGILGDELPTMGRASHENVKKSASDPVSSVSEPSTSYANSPRAEHQTESGDDPDEPNFDIEDK
ncbi:Integrase core domain protein [Sulfitobacter sp. THAF37]|nr:Integrase core domain protein [Sulfitobacter sp. THAF37]